MERGREAERGGRGWRVRGARHREGLGGGEGVEGEGCYTWGGVERGRGGEGVEGEECYTRGGVERGRGGGG